MIGQWNCVRCASCHSRRRINCQYCGFSRARREISIGAEAPLWALGLSTRTFNCLTRDWARRNYVPVEAARVGMTIGDVAAYSVAQLLFIRQFGFHCLDELRGRLTPLRLSIRERQD
jgi:hypothetical protein